MKRLLLLVLVFASSGAFASELVIGSVYRPVSLDPHLTSVNDSNSILSHVYDRLIWQDETLALRPSLALSWRAAGPTVWEIRLREGVRFHDGSTFTAEDVAFSIARIRRDVAGVDPYLPAVAHIADVEIVDPHTLRLTTDAPRPQLPVDLASFFIVSHGSPDDPGRQIGSGPYVVDDFRAGDRVALHADPAYWAGRPAWDRVELRTIQADAARVVALLSGDVDVIDLVPARDLDRIRGRGLVVASTPAARSNFIEFDQLRAIAPGVTDAAGHPIGNPFRDPRVRRALSMAIDRQAIVQRILGGYATAAAQLFPPGFDGASPNLAVQPTDPAGARRLLAEAGYPEGFGLTLYGTADRYPGDSATLQAVAQMWTRIGVRTTPVPLPWAVYSAARNRGEYGAYYAGASGADIAQTIVSVLHTPDAAHGLGGQNLGGYSDPAEDATMMQAVAEFDPARRAALFAEATDAAMAAQAIIPLYHSHNIWAFGPKLSAFRAHPRGWTKAMQAVPR